MGSRKANMANPNLNTGVEYPMNTRFFVGVM
jgi:hypothetical protein